MDRASSIGDMLKSMPKADEDSKKDIVRKEFEEAKGNELVEKLLSVEPTEQLRGLKVTQWRYGWVAGVIVGAMWVILTFLSFSAGRTGEVALQIANSNLMLALVAGVVIPWVSKIAKDRLDITLEENEIKEVFNAVPKVALALRAKVEELRKDGTLDDKDKELIRKKRVELLTELMGEEKVKRVYKKVGSKIFDNAFDEFAKTDWYRSMPVEKAMVKDLAETAVKASLTIHPKEWSKMSEDEKATLTKESVNRLRALLDQLGVKGWESILYGEVLAKVSDLTARPKG